MMIRNICDVYDDGDLYYVGEYFFFTRIFFTNYQKFGKINYYA